VKGAEFREVWGSRKELRSNARNYVCGVAVGVGRCCGFAGSAEAVREHRVVKHFQTRPTERSDRNWRAPWMKE
jgi:hypothetical protein